MNKYTKTFLGLLIIFIPAILILGLLFNNLSQRSFYTTSGELAVSGLKSQVKVYFDDFGVPQIIAQNEDDAYFTLGYMHAQDRLWQMDLTRRVAEGRLSEIFGSGTLDFDRFFRTIGIHRFAYNWYSNISPKSRQILESYTKGVNSFIETYYDNLPVEFDALNYRPEPWKPEQSLMLARMMGWDLNIAWYTDYILGELVGKAGLERTAEIFPDTNITIYKKPVIENDSTEEKDELASGEMEYFRQVSDLGSNFFRLNESYRRFLNINGSHVGSNSWVISSERSATGKPILANDPHLALQAPSRWYEVMIKGGDLDVRGMSFPGIPGIVIGNNRYITWGLTNLMNDDNDFVILRRDSENSNKYFYNNRSFDLDSIKEKIYVKDSLECEFVIKTTAIGPVISDLKIRGFADYLPSENANNPYKDKIMTFKWTGFEISDDFLSFYRINTSKNWEEFKRALKDFCVPAQNFTYADIYGNIGYHAAGKIPIRKTINNNNYLIPAEDELEWTGFIDFEKMPSSFNPKEGYIITANTDPFEWMKEQKEKYFISYLWESSSRFKRINEFLRSRSRFDLDDISMLQNNYESPYAQTISSYIPIAFGENGSADLNTNWCIERFKIWNGEMNPDESIGAVYNAFLVYLIRNTFLDELGEDVFKDFLIVQNMPYRSLELIMRQNENKWFDNVNTTKIESRDDIIRLSLQQAIEFLKTQYINQDINTWNWGGIHKVKFRHPLGIVESLDNTFNIGPYDVGGDQTSVNNTEYSFNEVLTGGKFGVVVGPSMRMIVNLADIGHPLTINSTGQSGQPVSSHYSDQARMWLYGEYKKNVISEMEMLGNKYSLLILNPKN